MNVTVDGTTLTQSDIDEAEDNGFTDGKTVIHSIAYEDLATDQTVTIGTVDGSKNSVTITIKK